MEHFIVTEIGKHGYLAIFVLMTLESTCLPIPSEAVMGFAGALTADISVAGITTHFNLWEVTIVGALGNLAGSLIAYVIGRTGGRALVEHYGKYILIRHRDLDKAEAFFAKHGDPAVLISRILPVVRSFISFPAGIAEMPVIKFSILTLIGSLPWTLGLTLAGRALAANWQTVSKTATPISVIFALAIVAVIVRWYMQRRAQVEH